MSHRGVAAIESGFSSIQENTSDKQCMDRLANMFVSNASCKIGVRFEFCWYRNISPHIKLGIFAPFFSHSTSRISISPRVRYLSLATGPIRSFIKSPKEAKAMEDHPLPPPTPYERNLITHERKRHYGT